MSWDAWRARRKEIEAIEAKREAAREAERAAIEERQKAFLARRTDTEFAGPFRAEVALMLMNPIGSYPAPWDVVAEALIRLEARVAELERNK